MTLSHLTPWPQKKARPKSPRMRSSKRRLEGIPCFMPFAMRWWRRRRFCFCTTHHRLERSVASNAGATPQRRVYLWIIRIRRAETRPGSTEKPCRLMCFLFRLEQRRSRRQRWKAPIDLTTSPCVRQTVRFSELGISPCQRCIHRV
jgi:hypothetical protein